MWYGSLFDRDLPSLLLDHAEHVDGGTLLQDAYLIGTAGVTVHVDHGAIVGALDLDGYGPPGCIEHFKAPRFRSEPDTA